MILLTHGHYDHVRAIPALLEVYPDLPVYIHEKELCPAEDLKERYHMPHKGKNQRTYDEGDTLTLETSPSRSFTPPAIPPGP